MNIKHIDEHITKSLQWILSNIKKFDPINVYDDKFSIKMLAELQLVLQILHRYSKSLNSDNFFLLEKLKNETEKFILNPNFYERALIEPNKFRLYANIIIYYLTYRDNNTLKSIISKLHKKAIDITPEIIPYRKMDFENSLQLASSFISKKTDYITALSSLSKESILNSTLDIINFSEQEEYALTHSIFYLTNFGEYTVYIHNIDKIQNSINSLVVKNILINNMDLLGEYIICYCNLNIKSKICDLAFEKLISSQNNNGVTLSPKSNQNKELNINDNDIGFVRRNYHTTLVSIIAYLTYSNSRNVR